MILRVVAAAAMLCGLALAAPGERLAPLKQLCERICGGVWEPEEPGGEDAFVTTYSFAWDEAAELIAACAGVYVDATIDNATRVAGTPAKITVSAVARASLPAYQPLRFRGRCR